MFINKKTRSKNRKAKNIFVKLWTSKDILPFNFQCRLSREKKFDVSNIENRTSQILLTPF